MIKAALAVLPMLSLDAGACAVCFARGARTSTGAPLSGLFDGFWWGIVLLLAVTGSALGGIGWLLWRVERDRAAQEAH